jgi:hypothetical protein
LVIEIVMVVLPLPDRSFYLILVLQVVRNAFGEFSSISSTHQSIKR